jgi:hypothetical protein
MRRSLPVLLTLFAISAARSDDPKDESDRARVVRFLKAHVIGRTVATPTTTFKLHDNTMEGEYADRTSYSQFAETATGFQFDMTIVSTETRYELDKAGKRTGPGKDVSGTEVFRYEFCERASSRKVTGIARLITKTTKGPFGEATATLLTGVTVTDGKLVWNETIPGYTDLIGPRGTYKVGSYDGKSTMKVVDGKLVTEFESKRFDVDPETLKRTPTADRIPAFVAKEVDGK